jgi:PAS domain S-box-containing protein
MTANTRIMGYRQLTKPRVGVPSVRTMVYWLASILILAATYFAAAKLGLALAFTAEQVSIVWPPTGIALAAVLLFGYRLWPGIALGAFLANATANEPLGTACAIAAGNTLEALVGAWLLRRFVRFKTSVERLHEVLGLIILAAGLSTVISATIGVASLCLGGVPLRAAQRTIEWSDFGALWWVWWLGDAMGALVVAPVLLTWVSARGRWPRRRLAEALALLAGLIGTCLMVFTGWVTGSFRDHSVAYTIFPFVIWAALRFGQRGATTVTLVASSLAIWGTWHGFGPFATDFVHERMLLLQLFMAVVAITALLLGAVVSERRRNEQRMVLLHAIARILAESATLAEATPSIVQAICQNLGWPVGAIWRLDAGAQVLRCIKVWHEGPKKFHEFEATTGQITFAPGIGLPGRVWTSGLPAWIPDVTRDDNFPRAPVAAREGLHSAFGFPIRLGDEILGILEFFSSEIHRPDDDLLQMMATVGSQIGQFIERKRGEEAMRHSEARKAAVLESALDAIITMDNEGRIVEFNPAAERIFGYARAAVIDKPMDQLLLPPGLRDQHRRGLVHYLATGEPFVLGQRLELPALRADGTEFPAELTITRIPVSGPPMFTGYLRDITERKRAEEALREADRRKDEFLAMLAHELRNPLAPIRTGIEIMQHINVADPQLRNIRDMLGRQVHQLGRLVDDLLDVSRITRGKVQLRRESLELATAVARAVEISRPVIDARRHKLTVHPWPEPLLLEADPVRLAQVFANLLNNAAKFTDEGGRLELKMTREDGQAVVRVRDTGIGIAADMLPHVFDLFSQANRSVDRVDGGLGIGLTLARSLVEMHHGSIQATSAGLGRGSEFVVRLPLLRAESRTGASTGSPIATESSCAAIARQRVLVVDDNQDAADSLGLFLKLAGHDVWTMHDGPTALQAAQEFHPDVVLLDIGLPGMNGYEVARRMRQMPAFEKALLVAITGYGQEEDKRLSKQAGFNVHLVKPVDPHVVHALLARSASRPNHENMNHENTKYEKTK